jgi:hypothetical protein
MVLAGTLVAMFSKLAPAVAFGTDRRRLKPLSIRALRSSALAFLF